MALDANKRIQQSGITPEQPVSAQVVSAESKKPSVPIDMMTSKNKDPLRLLAMKKLMEQGNMQPTEAQINEAVAQVLKENGCKSPEEFYETNIKGLSVESEKTNDPNKVIAEYKGVLFDENLELKDKTIKVLEKYYSKHDSEFVKLSQEDKDKYIKNKLIEMQKILHSEKNNATEREKLSFMADVITLTIHSEIHDTALEDVKLQSKEEINATLKNVKNKMFNHFINKVEQNINEGKYEESFERLIYNTLLFSDDAFASKSIAEQKKICKQYEKEFIKANDLNVVSDDGKKLMLNLGVETIKYLKDENISFEEYMNFSPERKAQLSVEIFQKSDKYKNLTLEERGAIDEIAVKAALLISLGEGEHTQGELYEKLLELEKTGNLADEELALLKKYKKQISDGVFNPDVVVTCGSNILIKALTGIDISTQIKARLKGVTPDSEEWHNVIRDYAKKADNDGMLKYTNEITGALEELEYPKELISQFLQQLGTYEAQLRDCKNGAEAGEAISNVNKYGSEAQVEAAGKAYDGALAEYGDQYSIDSQINITYDPNNVFTDIATTHINALPQERADSIYNAIYDNASASRKSQVAQSSVKTAISPQQQEHYFSEFTKRDDRYINEGLAAAEKYVDASVKSNCQSYIDQSLSRMEASGKYSKEEISQIKNSIKNARETGEISKETLAKTSAPEAKSDTKTTEAKANEAKTGAQTNAQANAQNAQSAQKGSAATNPQSPAAQKLQELQKNLSPIDSTKQKAMHNALETTLGQIETVKDREEIKKITEHELKEEQKAEEKRKVEEQIAKDLEKSEALRKETLEKVQQVRDHINEAVEQWQKDHTPRVLSDDDINALETEAAIEAAVDALDVDEHTDSFKAEVIRKLKNASSIVEVYDILVSVLGSKVEEKFIERLASSGSSDKIMAFIKGRPGNRSKILMEIYSRCQSYGTKKELLGLMSPDEVLELLRDGRVSHFDMVPYGIRFRFIRELVSTGRLSLEAYNSQYAQYLDEFDRADINAIFNEQALLNAQTPQTNAVQTETESDTPKQNNAFQKSEQSVQFAAGEISKEVGGDIVTRIGTTEITEDKKTVAARKEQPEIGSAKWKEEEGKEDSGMIALNVDNDKDKDKDNLYSGPSGGLYPNREYRKLRDKRLNFMG